MDEFDRLQYELKLLHNDSIRRKYWEEHNINNRARQEYAAFCIWCRAYKNAEFSEKNFKEYQQKEHTNFDFWLKKRIAELFFGYKFTFNYDTKKWQREKIKEGE